MSDDRYARQIVLPEVGAAGQARLRSAHLLVVGAGGLGMPVLQYLAGAGVGRITVVDPDVVDRSNLHRQTLFGEASLGRPKAVAVAEVLRNLNPEIEIRPVVERLDPANVEALLETADLALDCADSFAVSYTLSDACLSRRLPLISASCLALSGYAGGFCGGGPSLRAVFPELPDSAPSCATAGVLGPVVGLIGCLQAQMALAVVLGITPRAIGQIVSVDARDFRFSSFRFDTAPEPDSAPLRFLGESQIVPGDFVADLRGRDEAPWPVTPDAVRLTVEEFGAGGPLPRPDQRAVLCCRTGLRAWRAARRLETVWPGEIRLVALGDQCEPMPAAADPGSSGDGAAPW